MAGKQLLARSRTCKAPLRLGLDLRLWLPLKLQRARARALHHPLRQTRWNQACSTRLRDCGCAPTRMGEARVDGIRLKAGGRGAPGSVGGKQTPRLACRQAHCPP